MVTLAISGRHRDAAAALCVDGKIVAAVMEDSFVRVPGIGYRSTGGFPFAATAAVFQRAGIQPGAVTQVAMVGRETNGATRRRSPLQALAERPLSRSQSSLIEALRETPVIAIDGLRARAAQGLLAINAHAVVVLVLDADSAVGAGLFLRQVDGVHKLRDLQGFASVTSAARYLAARLGLDVDDPFTSLEQLGRDGDPVGDAMARVLLGAGDGEFRVDLAALEDTILTIGGGHAATLSNVDSPNIDLLQRRRDLAASFVGRVCALMCDLGAAILREQQAEFLCVAGSLFASPRLNSRLTAAVGGRLVVAPVPEHAGLALGAAIATTPVQDRHQASTLALGPDFTQEEVKAALDNCRLDYVYEPDWERLLTRVSGLLARGKTVGWFQGSTDFGPRSLGGRSILCDPSNRYARENVNHYLKGRALGCPVALSVLEATAPECFESPLVSPFMLMSAVVKERWRPQLAAVLDHGCECTVHTAAPVQCPELCDLLAVHYQRTGVPGLINVSLGGRGEPTACTPRDAIRTMFSASMDVLVMKRFLIMKDYWLLRSEGT